MNEHLFDLIENTNRNVFLTGRAGTGKTTFVNDFVKKSRKNHIIVAPTGIAAINAGGVTIHSMFGLPLRPFVPTVDRIDAVFPLLLFLPLSFTPSPSIIRSSRGLEMPFAEGVYTLL